MKDVSCRFLFPVVLAALSGCLAGSPEQFFAYDLSKSTTSAAFRDIQPAVAVRGASCLMCHANVQSNLITDFGYGDPWFIHNAGNSVAEGSYYFNHELTTWQTANVSGTLYIPRVQLSRSTYGTQMNSVDPTKARTSMSLAELIQLPSVADLNGNPRDGGGSITNGVRPSTGPVVTEKNIVDIRAPTQTDILNIAPDLSKVDVGFQRVIVNGMPSYLQQDVSGLQIAGSGASAYVRNIEGQPFVCAGDVVVKGTLFLKNPVIVTSTYGCHLYVSGTVFMQGELTMNTGTTESLQISSARAVMMGFDSASVKERLSLPGSTRAWTLPNAYTRGVGTNSEKHTAIYNDSLKIPDLVDGAEAALPYHHVLVNAPEIHSRYSGGFQGAIVGEIVIFVLSHFAFTYDPIFQQIPVLPALSMEILKVQD